MKIENWKGEANVSFKVVDIEGDMGEDAKMDLIQQADGDVVVILHTPERGSLSVEFCSSSGGGRIPVIAKKLRELIAELIKDEALKTINPVARMKIGECTEENPCCDRRGEYSGFGSGLVIFECPQNCSCHD